VFPYKQGKDAGKLPTCFTGVALLLCEHKIQQSASTTNDTEVAGLNKWLYGVSVEQRKKLFQGNNRKMSAV
jgi:hypothetical protein